MRANKTAGKSISNSKDANYPIKKFPQNNNKKIRKSQTRARTSNKDHANIIKGTNPRTKQLASGGCLSRQTLLKVVARRARRTRLADDSVLGFLPRPICKKICMNTEI